eukprot:2296008-Prymnesium_polylepis.2
MNWPTTARANASTLERCAPTLPELSTTITRSTLASHGGGTAGGCGGTGGEEGQSGTLSPQSWTASICSNPDVAVLIFSVLVRRLPSSLSSKAEPHDVESTPSQMVNSWLPESSPSTLVTNGALYVS